MSLYSKVLSTGVLKEIWRTSNQDIYEEYINQNRNMHGNFLACLSFIQDKRVVRSHIYITALFYQTAWTGKTDQAFWVKKEKWNLVNSKALQFVKKSIPTSISWGGWHCLHYKHSFSWPITEPFYRSNSFPFWRILSIWMTSMDRFDQYRGFNLINLCLMHKWNIWILRKGNIITLTF